MQFFERIRAHIGHLFRDRHGRKAAEAIERILVDCRQAVRERDARQAPASAKGIDADMRHAVQDLHAREVRAPGSCRSVIIEVNGRIVVHRPLTAQGQNAFVAKRPGDIAFCAARLGQRRAKGDQRCQERH